MTYKELMAKLLGALDDHDPFSPHKIQFYLILIQNKGEYTHFVDFNNYHLSAGSAVFIAKNQVHHFSKKLEQSEGLAIIFNGEFLEQEFLLSEHLRVSKLFNYHLGSPLIKFEELAKGSFSALSSMLREEYEREADLIKPEILQTLLKLLLLNAERTRETESVRKLKTRWVEVFNEFKTLLENEYMVSRSSVYYAEKLIVSYKFLNDVVKAVANKKVKEFIDDHVIMEIKRCLVSSSLSVKEVGYQTGFEDSANMVKFFKKHTGTTPLKFRENF